MSAMENVSRTDPVTELVDTLKAVRRDVDQLRQEMQGTLKAAQAAEVAAAKPRTLSLDVSALGPAFGTLSERIASLDTAFSELGADRLRSEVTASLHDARAGIDAAIQEGVRRHASSRWTLRLTVILGLVVLSATGLQFAGAAASTAWHEAERARIATEVERLRVALLSLQAQAEDWQRRAGRAVLATCPSNGRGRLCARIDLGAPRFGTRGEYAVLDGY